MPTNRWTKHVDRLGLWAATAVLLAGLVAPGAFADESDAPENLRTSTKRDVTSSRLLVPHFEVDVQGNTGTTTLFAVRNESLSSVEIDVHYFEADAPQAPQVTDRAMVAAKGVYTINLSFVRDLEVDPDGFARGYVIIEQVGAGAGVLHGDTFQIDPGNNFATGTRLLDIDADSPDNDACSAMTIRFLKGGGFDGGTVYRFWIDTAVVPLPEGSLAYSVYNEAGDLVVAGTLTPVEASFELAADQLLTGPASGLNFGAIEFQLDGTVGHVSSTLSALSRYSVGLEATCLD